MKRIGLFGGSFDPIHFGHIHLALSLLEKHDLDEVWWIPAAANPLKDSPIASAEKRLQMLYLGLEGMPAFKVFDNELKRGGPSYTFDTLQEIKAQFPEDVFYLLTGEDLLFQLQEWKNPLEIVKMAHPLIGSRQSAHFPEGLNLQAEILSLCRKGWTPIPLLEISATCIRKRLSLKMFCRHLVPAKVLDYIHLHRLYLST